MFHDLLPIPLWSIIALMIVIIIPAYVLIAGRNAEGGFKGRTSHGWSRWRELSQKAADVQARVLLTIFYYTLMAPFGFVMGILKDPLRVKHRPTGTYWLERKPVSESLADAQRQF
jgi:hypothetical protein